MSPASAPATAMGPVSTWAPLRPSRGRAGLEAQNSRTSWRISSGCTPNRPRKLTGSSSCVDPWWDMVSMRTVSPDSTVSTGGLSVGIQPQLRFCGCARR